MLHDVECYSGGFEKATHRKAGQTYSGVPITRGGNASTLGKH